MFRSHSGDEVELDFWTSIIGANTLTDSASVVRAIDNLKSRLGATSQATISAFDKWLSWQIYTLDRKEHFKLPAVKSDGTHEPQSEDHFLYARCACILSGHAEFTSVLNGNKGFIDFTSTRLQSAELLLYAADEVYGEVFGVEIERAGFAPLEAGSNLEFWR